MVSCRCSLQPSDVKNLRPEKFLGQEVLICFDAREIQEIPFQLIDHGFPFWKYGQCPSMTRVFS